MASKMILYWASGSPPAWRVLLVLHEKDLAKDCTLKLIAFDKNEHKSPELLSLNPRGQIPTFAIGNLAINESLAACDYLESVYSSHGHKLIPDDAAKKAVVLQRKYEALNLQKKGNEDLAYVYLHSKPETIDQALMKTRKQALADELNIWEGYLKQGGDGAMIAGNAFSLADCVFFPQLAFLVRLGLKLSPKFPQLASYYTRMVQRPSVQASWPPHWKDSHGPNHLADV